MALDTAYETQAILPPPPPPFLGTAGWRHWETFIFMTILRTVTGN
jgi:hypothetical protein